MSVSNIPTGEITLQVGGNGIVMKDGDADLLYHLMDSVPTVYENISPKKWLQFPLKPGSHWESEWESEVRRRNRRTTSIYTVIGWEQVLVGQNSIKALKIVRDDRVPVGFQKFEYWYAPQVKAVVKVKSENGAGTTYDVILTSFKLFD